MVESWVKQIVPLEFFWLFGCTNNGQLLIDFEYHGEHYLFDLETLHENRLDVHGPSWVAHTTTFVESLVLLNQV